MYKKIGIFLLLLIITIPTFYSLIINNYYFNMHDDNHIVRLYLLHEAISQGNFYPRWVDGLGFGYGYPLFNFYPPLIYYIAEGFHILGMSLIWSTKLMLVVGYLLAAFGMYFFANKIFKSKITAVVSSTFYSYFFYHATTTYVRGAFAEFFTLSILPFLFYAIFKLEEKLNFNSSIVIGIFFSLIVLNHPLIAFPLLLFLFLIFGYLLIKTKNKKTFTKFWLIGFISGLCISAFFWIPSIVEKKLTFVDDVLTKDLYNYKLHFTYLQQLWYSPWGFGASVEGPYDGISFQLGKIYILFFIISTLLALLTKNSLVLFFSFLTTLSIFMTTDYSKMIWDNIKYFWYIQFPWRFFTFTAVFISIVNSYIVAYLFKKINKKVAIVVAFLIIFGIIYKNYSFFKPQKYLKNNDNYFTSEEEIKWHVSRSSFEFSLKEIATRKTDLNVITLDILQNELPKKTFAIISGKININQKTNKFTEKKFDIVSDTSSVFQLNTYNFPGWKAYIDNKEINISTSKKLRLITVKLPKGKYELSFKFENTPIRILANVISISSILAILFYIIKKHVKF